MAEVVDIEFRAKIAQLQTEIEKIPGITKKNVNGMVSDFRSAWKQAEKESATGVAGVAREAGKLQKIGGIIGGQFGGVMQLIADGSEAVSDGLGAAGVAALGFAAAGGVVLAVGAGIASVVGDVVHNLDDYEERLGVLATTATWYQQRDQIEGVQAASAGLRDQIDLLSVAFAAELAPALQDVLDVGAGVVSMMTDVSTWSHDAYIGASLLFPVIYQLGEAAGLAADALDWLAGSGRSLRQVRAEQEAIADANAAWMAAAGKHLDQMAEEEAQYGALGVELLGLLGMTDDVSAATARDTEAKKESAEASRRRAEQLRAEVAAEREAAQAVREHGAALGRMASDISAAAGGDMWAAVTDEINASTFEMANASEAAQQRTRAALAETRASLDETREKNRETSNESGADWMGAASAIYGSASNLWSSITDLVSQSLEEQANAHGRHTKAYRDAKRKQFKVEKELAIASVWISAAAGIMQGYAQSGPIVGTVLAALTIAAAGIQTAVIAKQNPSFHGGGLAPDEMRATLTRGEGVLSPRGVATVGGPDGVRQANRGLPVAAAPSMTVIALDGSVLQQMTTGRLASGKDGLAARIRQHMAGLRGRRLSPMGIG